MPSHRAEVLAPIVTERTRELVGIQLELGNRALSIAAPTSRATGINVRGLALRSDAESREGYEETFDKQCPRTRRIPGRSWTPRDLERLRQGVRDTLPLLQCGNHPIRNVGLVGDMHRLVEGKNARCKSEELLGMWIENRGAVFLTPDSEMRGTTIHEIGHAVLQSFDPRTCTHHPNLSSPLVREWGERMGWDGSGEKLVNPAGNRPPTRYARTHLREDMAESLDWYLQRPEALRRVSPLRHAFYENLFATLRAQRVERVVVRDERSAPPAESRRRP